MAVIKKFRIKSFKRTNPLLELKNISISFGERKILDNWAVVATAYMSTKSWLKFFKHVK